MGRQDYETETETVIVHSLRGEGFDASEDGTGRGIPLIADTLTSNGDAHSGYRDEKGLVVAIQERAVSENTAAGPQGKGWQEGTAYTLEARNKVQAVAQSFNWQSGGDARGLEPRNTVSALTKQQVPAITGSSVRRLTPRECERLQGFPDDFTLVPYRGKPASDGPRYKALGNSMAVPVMAFIGQRIARVERQFPAQSLNHLDRQGSEADSLAAAGGEIVPFHEVCNAR